MNNEEKCNLLKAIKPEGGKTVSVDIKKEESTFEEWKNIALKLINQENIEQAKDIAEELSNKKHTQEIMSTLEAKKDEDRKSLIRISKQFQS
ncbi:MAG: hypothetical protein ACR5KV_06585 [Wolbachia sp.]